MLEMETKNRLKMSDSKGFQGLTVAAFESRMLREMTRLIERHGGRALVAPSMREIPLGDNPAALEFGERLLAGQFDMVVWLTGVGIRSLMAVLQTRFSLEPIKDALRKTLLVVRGPKPVVALKELDLTPHITVPEPNTWRDLLQAVDDDKPEGIKGLHVAIQEYGVSNPDLLSGFQQRGAVVTPVPVYRWALPDETGPLRRVLEAIVEGKVDVMLITNAVQVDHLIHILEHDQRRQQFQKAVGNMMVASIGSMASERLRQHGLPVDFEPSHSRMGVLVKEASEQAHDRLRQKRGYV